MANLGQGDDALTEQRVRRVAIMVVLIAVSVIAGKAIATFHQGILTRLANPTVLTVRSGS